MNRFLHMAPAVVVAVVCGLVAALLGSAAAASAGTLSAGCPDANGPAYSVAGRSTHLYVVEVRGVSCAFAAAWVGKLAAQPRVGPLRGPAGWSCIAASKTGSRLAVFGGCGLGRLTLPVLPAKGFGWYPDLRGQ
jgi:hypothetical protein